MTIDQEQLTRLDELAAAIHGKGTTVEMLNRWAAFESACKPDLIQAMVAELVQLKAENEALRKDAERYRFVRNPIGASSPLAIWNEGKMPLFSGMADAVVDEFMAKEATHG